jgi:hypothetical protein
MSTPSQFLSSHGPSPSDGPAVGSLASSQCFTSSSQLNQQSSGPV